MLDHSITNMYGAAELGVAIRQVMTLWSRRTIHHRQVRHAQSEKITETGISITRAPSAHLNLTSPEGHTEVSGKLLAAHVSQTRAKVVS